MPCAGGGTPRKQSTNVSAHHREENENEGEDMNHRSRASGSVFHMNCTRLGHRGSGFLVFVVHVVHSLFSMFACSVPKGRGFITVL